MTLTFIFESGNYRILKFNSIINGVDTGTPAAVIGQANFTEQKPNLVVPNGKGFFDGRCFAVSKKYLVVGSGDNRVLIFDKFAKANAPEAIAIIGQSTFSSITANVDGISSKTLNNALCGLAIDADERLYVADRSNHRILVFNTIPTTNFAAADWVIGQPDFVTSTASASLSGLSLPTGISVYEDKLLVADAGSNRVVVFDLPITQNQPNATAVIAQPDYTTAALGLTDKTFNLPYGVEVDPDGRLYVIDSTNSRVLVWNTIPVGSSNPATSADIVLGQANFTSISTSYTASTFVMSGANGNWATGIGFMNGYALIPDYFGNRILGFEMDNLATGMAATYVWGQVDFVTNNSVALGFMVSGRDGSFYHLSNVAQVKVDPYDEYIWLSQKFNKRVLRIKKNHFWDKKVQ